MEFYHVRLILLSREDLRFTRFELTRRLDGIAFYERRPARDPVEAAPASRHSRATAAGRPPRGRGEPIFNACLRMR